MKSKKDTSVEVTPVSTEVAEVRAQEIERAEGQTLPEYGFMLEAIQRGASTETMAQIMDMRRELRADDAREKFDRAMAAFQGECPVIEKSKAGGKTKGGSVAYKYAPLDVIVEQVKGLLAKHGLSYLMKTDMTQTHVKVTCIVKHEAGHREESTMEVPLGAKTEIMSAPQVVAATMTFAKRYAFCNALGIMTGDEDTDAQRVEEPRPVRQEQRKPTPAPVDNRMIEEEQIAEIMQLFEQLGKTFDDGEKWVAKALKREVALNRITYAEADKVITVLAEKAAKPNVVQGEIVNKEPVVNVVDPSKTERRPEAPEAPKESLPTQAMNCATQEEANDIIGMMTLSKVSDVQTTAIKNILAAKGFKV